MVMSIFELKPDILTNFPDDYPSYKKIFLNVVFNLAGFMLFPRKNLLSKVDIVSCKKTIKKGDIILVGNMRTVFGAVLADPITHAALAVDNKRVVHATLHGVEFKSLKEVYVYYDTIAILRIPMNVSNRGKIIKYALKVARGHLGKPYNYYYRDTKTQFFCSGFVNDLLNNAGGNYGYSTRVDTHARTTNLIDNFGFKIDYKHGSKTVLNALKPAKLLGGNFDIKFISHNLRYEDGRLFFMEAKRHMRLFMKNFGLYGDY